MTCHFNAGKNNGRYKTGISGTNGLYNSWKCMKRRCSNPNYSQYHNYGGRGIQVCEDWLDIVGFMTWAMQAGYQPGLTLDRIDNNGNYCPENCQWLTRGDNSRKRKTDKDKENKT